MKNWKTIKTLLTATAAAVMMLAVPIDGGASENVNEITIDDDSAEYTFEVDDEGNATLTSVTVYESEAHLTVPGDAEGNPVTAIGQEVFCGKKDIVEVDLGQTQITTWTIRADGKTAFEGCTNLTTVILPATLTNIPDYMFHNCSSLSTIEIPRSVTQYGKPPARPNAPVYQTCIFDGCTSLESITVADGNGQFTSRDGVLFSGTTLIAYPNAKKGTAYTVPDGTTKIRAGAFQNLQNLTEITIPASVTEIGQYAFMGSKDTNYLSGNSLQKVYLYSNLTISGQVFLNGVKFMSTGVTLTANPTTVKEGETVTLTATVLPKKVSNKKVTWSVDNKDLATIDNGVLTAKKAGTVKVTAEAADGTGASDTIAITIEAAPVYVTGIKIQEAKGRTQINKGEKLNFSAVMTPTMDTYPAITWSVDNQEIATIDEMGELTALKSGTVTVTVTSNDGNPSVNNGVVTAEYKVQVITKVAGISITVPDEMEVGQSMELTARVDPVDADNKAVTWIVDNSELAEITEDNKLTAKAEGTVNVTATAADGSGETDTMAIHIRPATVYVESITIKEMSDRTSTTVDGELSFEALINPSNAINWEYDWSVSDTSLAFIEEDGLFSALAAGKVKVIATSKYGDPNVNGGIVIAEYEVDIQPKQETKPTEPETPPTEPQQPATEPQQPATEPQQPATEPQQPETEPQIQTVKQSTTQATLKWVKDESANAGYRIYVKGGTAKKWTKVAETKSTAFNLKKIKGKKLQSGTDYQVRIVSLNKKGKKTTEGRRLEMRMSTSLEKVKLTRAKKVKAGTVQLKWKKVRGAAGYEIQMKDSKNGSYATVKTLGKKATSYKQSGLGKKKTVYYRVRAFKNVNGKKVFSGWTNKKVKI